ncbi:MAG TPA: hypothetical protein VNM72_15825, partial [Blastocatellia bacterium]|nr:hypothetical protein [Blastocatellia bacterium]
AGNDLEAVILDHFPAVRQMFDRLADTRAQVVRMSGSGPTLFAVFDNEQDLAEAQARVAHGSVRIWRTRTVSRREYVEAMGL